MKSIGKTINYGYAMKFFAGHDGGRISEIEIYNFHFQPMKIEHDMRNVEVVTKDGSPVAYHVKDNDIGCDMVKITLNNDSQRKCVVEGLRFIADVLEGQYDDLIVK